jgi:hypothetical protein
MFPRSIRYRREKRSRGSRWRRVGRGCGSGTLTRTSGEVCAPAGAGTGSGTEARAARASTGSIRGGLAGGNVSAM